MNVKGKKGFTLLEVLVASLLLGMLVTILTMVFNQSSIAWRVGKAGVAKLDRTRREATLYQHNGDNALPGVSDQTANAVGVTLGAWDMSQSGSAALRKRAVEMMTDVSFSALSSSQIMPWQQVTVQGANGSASAKSYVVIVRSDGPDRREFTKDDISSWPLDK